MLEGRFQQILANAAHIKGVPGRKSDIERCDLDRRSAGAWPDPGELCAAATDPGAARSHADEEATDPRDRRSTRCASRAVLEEANVKLISVITDILGASGRRILRAI